MFEYADFSTFAPDDKIKYINDMTTERDIYNQIEYAHDKGYEEAERKEREKHRAEILRIAKNFLDSGVSVEDVARNTGLSPEEVEAL